MQNTTTEQAIPQAAHLDTAATVITKESQECEDARRALDKQVRRENLLYGLQRGTLQPLWVLRELVKLETV